MTFFRSISPLFNVGCLLFLFLYLYAVMGVYFFSGIKLQEFLNKDFNFQTFGNAFITLFVLLSGENWCFVMEDCARSKSATFECHTQTYAEQQLEGIQGCGKPWLAYPYFMSFQVLMTFTMLNLFIAIILEAFGRQLDIDELMVQPETFKVFGKVWKQFDPDATGFIEHQKIMDVIMQLFARETQLQTRITLNAKGNILFEFNKEHEISLFYFWKYPTNGG